MTRLPGRAPPDSPWPSVGRRELLALLLGAPVAASACRHLPRRTVAGEIVGADLAFGHRLRGATVAAAAGAPTESVDVVIVGGGISGLSAAWWLDRAGHRSFRVIELEAAAGGTSVSGDAGVAPHPWGAHYVPVPGQHQRDVIDLLDEVGALEPSPSSADGRREGREGVLVRAPEERLFHDGEFRPGIYPRHGATEADLAELARFEALVGKYVALRDGRGRPAFTLPVDDCSDDAEFVALDRITAAELLEREGFRSPRLRFWLEYGTRDDFGLALAEASAWALLFYHSARRSEPGAEPPPYLTWPEGNGRIVRHLSARAGDRLRTGRLVTDVVPREGGVDVLTVGQGGAPVERVKARRAILAVPQHVVGRILRPFRDAPPPHLRAFTSSPWLVANLHLRGRPKSRGVPIAWDTVLHDSPSLGYVTATHQLLADRGPTVLTYYHPFVDADPRAARGRLAAADHAGLCDSIVADLARAHPDLEELIERIDVMRHGHAMVRPVPGLITGAERRAARVPLGPVHFAHSDLSGVALLEEAQAQGLRAAREVVEALRAGGRE